MTREAEHVCRTTYREDYDRWFADQYSAPRERIVRCRDCAYGEPSGLPCGWIACRNFNDPLDDERATVEPDGFCAWGEPRDK